MPKYVTQLDVHQMPGCFQTEYTKNDATQGAVYHQGTQVFFGGFGSSITTDIGRSIAHFVALRYPKFKPERILDIGCTAGANTTPYLEVFPKAEVHGIDVGAPVLRYGHALAEATGKKVHFHQRNAEHPEFPDNHFDLITSSFFFHEVSVPATKRILRECHRMLKPGGLMIHMELPPTAMATPYQNFYYDWDAFYNNEPHYELFRNLDFAKTLTDCGFKKNKLHFEKIPNWSNTRRAEFEAVAKRKDKKERFHGHGRAWFTFGAWR
jgi:ubiquinone/menaquinone biosynthesis C-methylase UbiE